MVHALNVKSCGFFHFSSLFNEYESHCFIIQQIPSFFYQKNQKCIHSSMQDFTNRLSFYFFLHLIYLFCICLTTNQSLSLSFELCTQIATMSYIVILKYCIKCWILIQSYQKPIMPQEFFIYFLLCLSNQHALLQKDQHLTFCFSEIVFCIKNGTVW